jgi:hypothetical protein
MSKFVLPLVLVLGLGITGAAVHNANSDCVEVYIDFGPLNGGAKTSECVPVAGKTSAFDVLSLAGFTTEGTLEYGDAVICRVNNYPDITAETCEVMPPAEAYWAVLVKKHQIIPMPLGITGQWGWAQTGANEIQLSPGDSIGLVFADNGEVTFP